MIRDLHNRAAERAKPTRLIRALTVRDRVLEWLPGHSSFHLEPDGRLGGLTAILDGFALVHRTPLFGRFAKLPRDDAPANLAYGLDIWQHRQGEVTGKVMNFEWGHGSEVNLISFAKGEWDASLLARLESFDRLS